MWYFKVSGLTKCGIFYFVQLSEWCYVKKFLEQYFVIYCAHLPLWRGKVKDPRYMQNKKDPRISLELLRPYTLQLTESK